MKLASFADISKRRILVYWVPGCHTFDTSARTKSARSKPHRNQQQKKSFETSRLFRDSEFQFKNRFDWLWAACVRMRECITFYLRKIRTSNVNDGNGSGMATATWVRQGFLSFFDSHSTLCGHLNVMLGKQKSCSRACCLGAVPTITLIVKIVFILCVSHDWSIDGHIQYVAHIGRNWRHGLRACETRDARRSQFDCRIVHPIENSFSCFEIDAPPTTHCPSISNFSKDLSPLTCSTRVNSQKPLPVCMFVSG